MAWLKDGLVQTDAAVEDGIDSDGTVKDGVVSNKFTGDWVVMAVPVCAGIFVRFNTPTLASGLLILLSP